MPREEKKVLVISDDEQGLIVNGMMDFRNSLLRQDLPTEDVNDLILRIIDAPAKKLWRTEYEAR